MPFDEDTSLDSMLDTEDIINWCITFIKYFIWCNEYSKTMDGNGEFLVGE